MNNNELNALVRRLLARQKMMEEQHKKIVEAYDDLREAFEQRPRSITEEIDSIPGRRIFYSLSDRIDFTIAEDGRRGEPLNFLVSQDGPFIMTHYPLVIWKPNSPAGATRFGQWSPVYSWPLATQQAADQDRIDLSYEIIDGGSQRNFQNEAAAPIFSRPDYLAPLPVPTLFAPNTVIQFFPTYENILFDPDPATPTDGGQLVVSLPGYRIVNL